MTAYRVWRAFRGQGMASDHEVSAGTTYPGLLACAFDIGPSGQPALSIVPCVLNAWAGSVPRREALMDASWGTRTIERQCRERQSLRWLEHSGVDDHERRSTEPARGRRMGKSAGAQSQSRRASVASTAPVLSLRMSTRWVAATVLVRLSTANKSAFLLHDLW